MGTHPFFGRLAATALLVGSILYAAPERGTVQGTLRDPQGAVMPGVDVVVQNPATGVENRLKTNSVGFYLVAELVPGSYSVQFRAPGFAALDLSGVIVTAGGVAFADATMRVGSTAETVQVTAEAPLVEATAANFTTAIQTRYIEDLPINGRDIQTLVQLIPGVIQSGGPSGASFGFNSQFGGFPDPLHLVGSAISVNGGQAGANGWYLEGSLNATVGAEAVVVNPSPDAVSEFNLVSNGLAAEYGRTSGAVVNVVLKSGTNDPHGSLYSYNRNSFFSATNPYARRDESGKPLLQPRVNWNDPGGTFGGPVYIPKIYDGRNRTFFFFSEDVSFLHENVNRILTVPTVAERNGDFRDDPRYAPACDPANGITNCIFNPFTTTPPDATGMKHRDPFSTPVIPPSMINPIAKFYVASIPSPNYVDPLSVDICGTTCNNYIGAVGSGMTTHNLSLKLDHRISDKHTLFVDWLYNPSHYQNYRYPWNGPTAQLQTGVMGSQPYRTRNQLAIVGLTSTLRPTLINELRVSFGRQPMIAEPNPDSVTGNAEVKKMVAGQNYWLFDPYQSVPSITVGGLTWGPLPYQAGLSMGQQAYTFSDNLTKVSGKHTLKAGFAFRRNNLFNLSGCGYQMYFGSGPTSDPVTQMGGNEWATFLLGWVDQGSPYSCMQAAPWQTNDDWSMFGQDDFRVRSNLTLSFGLRWDVFGWIRERHDGEAVMNLDAANPEIPTLKGRIDYVNTPNHPDRNLFPANKGSLGPRFGFAWTPVAKTVLRGSIGIVYSNSLSAMFGQNNGAYNSPGNWVSVSAPITDPTYTTPSFVLGQPAPSLPIGDLNYNRTHNVQNLGGWTATFMKPPKDPYVTTWSFFIQRELPGNLVVNAGYVGSHGVHLAGDGLRNLNYVPTKTLQQLRMHIYDNFPTDPALSSLYGCELDTATNKAMCPGYYSFLPYPQYGSIAETTAVDGHSKYNAAQLRVEKRYSQGLNLIAAYTFSKNIVSPALGALVANTLSPSTSQGIGRLARIPGSAGGGSADGWTHTHGEDPDNRDRFNALSPDDTPHVLNMAITYELPVGKGKHFLSGGGRLADAVLGGWKLTQNWNFQSGVPMYITSRACSGDPWQWGFYSCMPNLVGDPRAGRGSKTKTERANQWYNPNAFTAPFGTDPSILKMLSTGLNPDGTPLDYNTIDQNWVLGNIGLRTPSSRVPGFWNVDASLSKEWKFGEARRFMFRYDLFNALNHQNLGIPDSSWCLPPNPDGSTDAIHIFGCQFGKITNVQTDPRAMQFGLKFQF